ncbi:MAG: hypothetical protein JWP12_1393 [Bacteroidetes bacterium]|nr:hypothetical protein [Bacteroidota bacterium]
MKLHETIERILLEAGKPLSVKKIAQQVNKSGWYKRKDEKEVESSQIGARVRQYNNLLQNINGYIFLTSDHYWKDILTSYWSVAGILRGILSISELQFVIACVFYFKRIKDLAKHNADYAKRFRIIQHMYLASSKNRNIPGSEKITFNDVIAEYLRIYPNTNREKEIEINLIISKLDTTEYNEDEFGNMFEYLLNLTSLDSNKSPVAYTPKSILELMTGLLKPDKHKNIYDPVSGTGGLLAEAQYATGGTLHSKAHEINHRVALLNLMNQEMHGYFNTQIYAKNCFEDLNNHETFDYIIGDLPIDGVANYNEYYSLFKQWKISAPSSGKGFSAILLYILSKLGPGGKAVITVSESFLFKKGKELEIRKILVEQDIVESVVGLPYGALRPNTEAKAAILVLNRNKKLKGKIKFIRAHETSSDKQGVDLNTEEILQMYMDPADEKSNVQIVDSFDLLKDYNLSAYVYDAAFELNKQMRKEGGAKLLGDLVEIRSGINIDKKDQVADGDVPFIKIENLSPDVLSIYLTEEQITSRIHLPDKFYKDLIHQECILVARIGDHLKPTYFKPSEKIRTIVAHGGVHTLIPKKNAIDLEYLYYQLNSEYIKEQLNRIKLGAVMPYMSISGLKQILIPYVEPKSQLEFVKTQKANIIASERAKIEDKIKLLGYKEERVQIESDIVRTLVHQLRPTLLNIDLEVKKIKRIVDNNDLLDFKEGNDIGNTEKDPQVASLITPPVDYSLSEIIQKLQHDTLQLNHVLTTVNTVMSFKLTPGDMEEVDLIKFFKEYMKIKKIETTGSFEIEVNGEHFFASINKPAFRDLIDQIFVNIRLHAFKGVVGIKKRVQFIIRQNKERGIAIIEYQNNGKPFLLTQKDFTDPFVKSQTSTGSGIGGNYIYRIVQAHNGEITVKEELRWGFALTIEMPLNQQLKNE